MRSSPYHRRRGRAPPGRPWCPARWCRSRRTPCCFLQRCCTGQPWWTRCTASWSGWSWCCYSGRGRSCRTFRYRSRTAWTPGPLIVTRWAASHLLSRGRGGQTHRPGSRCSAGWGGWPADPPPRSPGRWGWTGPRWWASPSLCLCVTGPLVS